MIASPDVLQDTRKKPLWPAMVREPGGALPVAEALSASGAATSRDDDQSPDSITARSGSGTRVASAEASRPRAGKSAADLARLGERIAELAARINSAEAQMMTLIADFDRRGRWKDGFGSCAEWLAWRIGIKIGPARERVRAARALESLLRTADALREGSISYAKVRALTRVATPGSEAKLLEFARAGSAAKLEQMVRMWKKRNTRGTNPGRKSSKVLQDCTICVSCRLTGPRWTGPQKRENRNRLAGILHTLPPLLRGPGSRISSPSLRCDALWVCVAGRPGVP